MTITKKVRLIDQTSGVKIVSVEVPWQCPTCGAEMGEPRPYPFQHEGVKYECDLWENPCGHKVMHKSLINTYGEQNNGSSKHIIRQTFEDLTNRTNMKLREGQISLSEEIYEASLHKQWGVYEAGTGTGKSNAYIVPMLLQRGRKFLISTATKALQDQVYNKDLPQMMNALGVHRDVLLYKGANNYLCLHRLEAQSIISDEFAQEAAVLREWLRENPSGDLNDYPDEILMGRHNVSVDLEACNPRSCRFAGNCPWVKLKSRVEDAHIIVTNHHLTLLSPDVKKGRFIILDEGHDFPKIATNVLGIEISDRKIRDDLENLYRYTDAMLSQVNLSKDIISRWLGHMNAVGMRVAQTEKDNNKILAPLDLFEGLRIDTHLVDTILNYVDERPMENFSIRLQRLAKFISFLDVFNSDRTDIIRHVEKHDDNFIYKISLRHIAPELRKMFWGHPESEGGAVISATLRYNGYFDYMQGKLGMLGKERVGVFPSPFNYQEQSALLIPRGMPTLDNPNYRAIMSDFIIRLINMVKGRTLLLFTSHQRMVETFEDVSGRVPYNCLMQGQQPLNILKEQFINDVDSVLFATKSFWTGIDVPGESLSCVYIDRIPFPQLGDPITKTITNDLTNPLLQYLVPEAALEMAQGIGRLIRKEDDYGLVVIGDERMLSKQYAERIRNTMPNMRFIDTLEQAEQWLKFKGII